MDAIKKTNWLTNICQAIYNSEDPSPVPVSPPQSHLPSNNCFHPPSPASPSHLTPATNFGKRAQICECCFVTLWLSLSLSLVSGWQKLAAFRRGQKSPQKFSLDAYLLFCDKWVVFTRNFEFANLIQYDMQYKLCNNALLAQKTLFCPKSSKKCVNCTNLNIATK